MFHRFFAATCLLLIAPALAGCKKESPPPEPMTIGHQVTHLGVRVGSIWGGGYSVDVIPENYVVVEHRNCPDAKNARLPPHEAEGLCVVRITKEQSDRFQAAMQRFKRNVIPLQSFSFDDPYVRPDGKPCKSEVTDSTAISLFWTGTDGIKMATYYTGCDREEFKDYYDSILAVTDALPIQQIIGRD